MQARATRDIGRAVNRHPWRAAIAGLAAAGLLALLVGGAGEGDSGGEPDRGSGDLLGMLASVPLPDFEPVEEPPEDVPGPRYAIAKVREGSTVRVHRSPGGDVIAKLTDRTEFGSERSFWVERVRGDWFGVPVPELPNGRLGWVRDDRVKLELFETRYWIVADRSERMLELRYGNEVLERFPVTVGAPGSPTPLGSYSVTDGLAGKGVGPYYGCCILALNGHQPHLPRDWLGGDRIAIHGTPGAIGGAESAGCLRASDPDLVSLFARVPLGAPVFIRG